ncbi:hypothetical protein GALMADRAFT_232227 [Galerina marginata CBS 339.88]|uniref:Uncharacterized protein n=1 Tax=Galerina marginata (strain CBS 339.88) TaxID=685588 RepID=A0A067S7Z2_GALM3|nr:hypothetical protein GALMADRAFT_232227 [Galerina marginata CBS 339.88]
MSPAPPTTVKFNSKSEPGSGAETQAKVKPMRPALATSRRAGAGQWSWEPEENVEICFSAFNVNVR